MPRKIQVVALSLLLILIGLSGATLWLLSRDTTPPEAPLGLTARSVYEGVKLTWAPNTEKDIAGYNIYRSELNTSYSRLNASLVTETTYSDKEIDQGTTYQYAVSALDSSDNESPLSEIVMVKVPHYPDVGKAVNYLYSSYNAELKLVYESPDASAVTVGAYYYGWWEPGTPGGHWQEGITNTPVLGEYDCLDETVTNRHIRWARDYGIDFFAISWWGPGEPTDIALKEYYLKASESVKLKFAVHYESVGRLGTPMDLSDLGKMQTFLSDFDYLAETYFGDPRYFRIDNRPVVFLYVVRGYQNAHNAFAQLKANMNAKGYDPYLIADVVWWEPADTVGSFVGDYFDAITGYNMYHPDKLENFLGQASTKYQEYRSYAENQGLVFVPGVMPEFDNRSAPPIPRSPEFYNDFWQIASESLGKDFPMVMVTSFNEWHEGTEIEPSQEYGIDYLEITKTNPGVKPYWLVSDNLWAMQALKEVLPLADDLFYLDSSWVDIFSPIRSRLIALADGYNLPQNSEGLPISYAHEVLIGEPILLPFKAPKVHLLESTIRTVTYDGDTMSDWRQYADLLAYAALSKHTEGKDEEATRYFEIAKRMWDGKGIVDKTFGTHYETYKLGLLLYTSKVLGYPLEFEGELIDRLWLQQSENGGFITGYLPNGAPDGYTTTEATSIILLAVGKWAAE